MPFRTTSVLCLLLSLVLTATARAEGPPCPLEALDWLTGNWAVGDDKSRTTEVWERTGEKSFKGFGQTVTKDSGEVTFEERMLLEEKDGGIFYTVMASQNEEPVAFRLTTCSEQEAVFENPDHDFPTRLHYRLRDGQLEADVRGPDGRGFTVIFGRDE
ncbi:DUF6265 family protein [Emcibacter sp.]|uniref:DUF6265 family protein n=1 Tax=Emcibacter sp. TaxID=1979954 RepID=UPI003A8CBE00